MGDDYTGPVTVSADDGSEHVLGDGSDETALDRTSEGLSRAVRPPPLGGERLRGVVRVCLEREGESDGGVAKVVRAAERGQQPSQ